MTVAAAAAGEPMKAVYYEKFRETPTIETLPDPAPAPGGVVIKVEATGLCRSDHHGWMGHDPDIRLPHVPGHELAGTVAAVGKGVTRFREGERVTLPFVGGCGHCHECHSGNQQVCPDQFQPGFTAWGSFAAIRRHPLRRHQPRAPARRHRLRDGGEPRLPLRHRPFARSSTRRGCSLANGWRSMAAAASACRRS